MIRLKAENAEFPNFADVVEMVEHQTNEKIRLTKDCLHLLGFTDYFINKGFCSEVKLIRFPAIYGEKNCYLNRYNEKVITSKIGIIADKINLAFCESMKDFNERSLKINKTEFIFYYDGIIKKVDNSYYVLDGDITQIFIH